MTIQELALQGKHNMFNTMAAAIAARVFKYRILLLDSLC